MKNTKDIPSLDNAKFTFIKEGNVIDGANNPEEMEIEFHSEIITHAKVDCFYILSTTGWTIFSVDELIALFYKIQSSINFNQKQ